MSETLSAERYPIEIIQGVEGLCIGLNNYRLVGPKPWGGGTVVKRWHVSLAELGKAIPEVATIEALQAEVTTLRTALEKAETNLRRYCRHQWNPRNLAFAVCDWCGEYQSLGGTTCT